jgi:hypothetical protein
MEWLYSLVKVEVSVAPKWFGRVIRISECDGRKRGHLGHYKKSIFRPREKCCFFAAFAIRLRTLVLLHEYGPIASSAFFVLVPKQAKKHFKKNIVSNLP